MENKNVIDKLSSVWALCRNICLCGQHGTAFQRISFMRTNNPNELKQSFSLICDVLHILVGHDISEASSLACLLWIFAQITYSNYNTREGGVSSLIKTEHDIMMLIHIV